MSSPTKAAINLLIWTIVFTVVDVVFVGLRFLAARISHRKIYADDYFIIFAMMNTFALGGVVIWAVFSSGMGHYAAELSATELQNALKLIPAAYVTWTLGTTSFKLSVLCLYTRIFSIKAFKTLSYVTMGLTVSYCISFMVVFLTTCTPDISQLWNPRPDGHCRDLNIGQLGSVSTNLALDVIILALPMPFVWNLKMALRNKIIVTIVFSFSLLTIGIMIWRIVDLVKNADADFVYNMPTLALTTTLELWLCIIIGCIPTLAPIFRTYITPALTKMTGSRKTISARSNPRNIVTFGGGRGRRQTSYINMMGSQDPIKADIGDIEREAKDNAFREDAFTTTLISSSPQPDIRLETLSTKNAIRVRHEVDTEFSH